MNRFYFVIFSFFLIANTQATPLEYFLPKGKLYNSAIPTPEAVLGQQLGDQHLRHDQIIHYLSILASANPRAKLIEYGKTNEGRRLVLLAISSSANISKLEATKNQPEILKIWNGFSVHGNESSGSNAAVLYAWYLLANSDEKIKNMLNDTVVLIDPSFNPDGLDRFTTYVNNNRSLTTVTDSNDFSHNEPWPGGRTNHYWFDLNRDWLLLTQTESRFRLAQFHQWQPHVLTDHHEMGSEKSYFFQPGVPERTNPLIPAKNIELTKQIAKFHAKALDEVRQAYYSEESFDDFYPGKGSTYPDLQGSMGILFEQSSAKGGVLETDEGTRKLEIGIRNQFLTALSSLNGSYAIKDDLIKYKKDFFAKAQDQATKDNIKGYLLDIGGQRHKGEKLVKFLQQHQIDAYILDKNKTIKSHSYKKNAAVFIPSKQKQYTLIKSLFSRETSFKDNTFYDVSAWNLAMAWGFHFDALTSLPETSSKWSSAKPENRYKKQAIAYVFDWQSGNAPAAINYLLNQQYVIKISAKPLNLDAQKLSAGSFILEVPKDHNAGKLFADLSAITELFQVAWYPL
ncbi:MAG: hypothetical protein L3J52_02460, partial [Proteobacteria bacterium]|nr:hypothetical protein [Pseudomonadota bacterium]